MTPRKLAVKVFENIAWLPVLLLLGLILWKFCLLSYYTWFIHYQPIYEFFSGESGYRPSVINGWNDEQTWTTYFINRFWDSVILIGIWGWLISTTIKSCARRKEE